MVYNKTYNKRKQLDSMAEPRIVNVKDVKEFTFEVTIKPIHRKFKDGRTYKTYRITLPKNFAELIEGKKVLVTVKVLD